MSACRLGGSPGRRSALPLWLIGSTALVAGAGAGPGGRGDVPQYIAMDYGPTLAATLEVDRGNFADKGLAVRLDPGAGGIARGRAFVAFDTDLLRYAAGWTGEGFIDWRGVAFDGQHSAHPGIVGQPAFLNPMAPGWADPETGSWDDPRLRGRDGRPYGPLPRQWAHWKGHYRHGDRVILAYSVGDAEILESPGLAEERGQAVFTRQIEIGPHQRALTVQVAGAERGAIRRLARDGLGAVEGEGSAGGEVAVLEGGESASGEPLDLASDFTLSAFLKTTAGGTILAKAASEGPWVPKGKCFFVRGGRLGFDVGWLGVVESRARVDDGRWHHVAVTYRAGDGRTSLFLDGRMDGSRALKSEDEPGHVVRLGYTATDFMPPFRGTLDQVRFHDRELEPDEIGNLARGGEVARGLLAEWAFGGIEPDKDRVANAKGGGFDGRLVHARKVEGRVGAGLELEGDGRVEIAGRDRPANVEDRPIVAAGVVGAPAGCRWVAESGQLRLTIPASEGRANLTLRIWRGDRKGLGTFVESSREAGPSPMLGPLARGGPSKWPEAIETRASLGKDDGPFSVDELTLPKDNPWASWMRLGGFDFLNGGRKAAVCTWQGDVWIVEGLGEGLDRLAWHRIAAGLFQPLGLKVVDNLIYVLGRDQITRLRDLNGDGETDFYENFNNDAQVTEHFHEFAMDLQADARGDFYYMKGGRHALDAVVPQHGTLLKVARDGSRTEIVARGMRAPNGLLIEPDGTFVTTDQEGHWTPMNRINRMRPGGFYGYMMGYYERERDPADFDPPLCWIHREYDRSPSEPLRVNSKKWGPLDGALLCLSYGTGRIWNVLEEVVGGQSQGGITQLPLPELPTGIQRGRFHPGDGQLYACGLVGWSSNQPRDGGFYRVRATGQPIRLPVGLSATKYGMVLTFSMPLTPGPATDRGRYGVRVWNYRRTANYGSDDYRVSDGSPGRDTLDVTGVKLSDDRRSVLLQIPGLTPCMQMEITYDLESADGAPLTGRVLNTVHRFREPDSLGSIRFEGGITPPPPPGDLAVEGMQPGLTLTLRQGRGVSDVRPARMLALYVPAGEASSPFLRPGPFSATFEGYLVADASGTYQFHARGRGRLALTVNGRRIIDPQPIGDGLASRPLALRVGANPIRAELEPIDGGETAFRMAWSSDSAQVPRETIPPTALRSRPEIAGLSAFERRRDGRTLFAERNCARCHALPGGAETGPAAMPELNRDNPSLDDVGSRLRPGWVYRWLLDPAGMRPGATMPRLFHEEPTDQDRRDAADLTAFLMALRRPNGEVEKALEGQAGDGEALFENLGCLACHTLEAVGANGASGRISLRHVGEKFAAGALREFLRAPQAHYAWSRMPDFGLSPGEAGSLAAFLLGRVEDGPGPVAGLDHADADRGRCLFSERGCADCHAIGGDAPARGPRRSSVFGTAGDSGCLADEEVGRGGAPAFGFVEAERRTLREFLRDEAAPGSLQRDFPAEFGRRGYRRYDCSACHARDGSGGRAPAILAEEGQRGIVPERWPSLTWAGEALRVPWAERRLAGTLPGDGRVRPWLKARMPRFPVVAHALAEGLTAEHGLAPGDVDDGPPPDPSKAELGRMLAFTKDGGLYCIQCHAVGRDKAVAPFENPGIDLALVPDRLRHEYYLAWMLDPQRIDPQTGMIKPSPDRRTTAVKSVAGGDAVAQFEALWQFLRACRPGAGRSGGK